MNVLGLKCFDCGGETDATRGIFNCPECGGNQNVVYDYQYIKRKFARESLLQNPDRSIWRYKPLLPINESSQSPFLQVGWTPIYSYQAWANELGIGNLIIKDDGRNPSAS